MHCTSNSVELVSNEMVLSNLTPLRPHIPVPTCRKKNFSIAATCFAAATSEMLAFAPANNYVFSISTI
jgi:hypothetical protein